MKIKILILLIVIVSLPGCTSHNVKKDYVLMPSGNKAIIFGSITSSKSPLGFQGIRTFLGKFMVHYRKIYSKDDLMINVDAGFFYGGDFKKVKGEIFVIEVPEGEYELYSWYIISGEMSLRPTRIFSIPFKAKANVITYLGEINMESFYGTNGLGFGVAQALKINFKDSYERDIRVFKNKYKNLANENIIKGLIKTKNNKNSITSKKPIQ